MASWTQPKDVNELLDKYLKGKIPDSVLASLRGKFVLKSKYDSLKKDVCDPLGLGVEDGLLDSQGFDQHSKDALKVIRDTFLNSPGPDALFDISKVLVPRDKYEDLEKKYGVASAEVTKVVNDLHDARVNTETYTDEMNVLNDEIEDLADEIRQLKPQLDELKVKKKEFEEQLLTIKKHCQLPANADQKTIEEELKKRKKSVSEFDEFTRVRASLVKHTTDLQNAKKRISSLEEDLRAKHRSINCLKAQLANRAAQSKAKDAMERGRERRARGTGPSRTIARTSTEPLMGVHFTMRQ